MGLTLVSALLLLLDTLAVTAALVIYGYTRVDHFQEGGSITILSVLQLLVMSWLSYSTLRARRESPRRPLWRERAAIWAIIALGFLFLAADEYFLIHENLDLLIHDAFNASETGLSDRIDDILVALYGLAGIGALILYRDELRLYRAARPFAVGGFCLLVVTVGLDALTNRNDILPLFLERDLADPLHGWLLVVEDAVKILAEGLLISALYAVLLKARCLRERPPVRAVR
jgi:hypothetical protein